MSTRGRGLLFATATALLWGVLAVVLKYSLRIADVETIVCFRFLLAFVLLGGLLAARRPDRLRILARPPLLAVAAALLLAVNYRFFFKGIELRGASNAQVLIQTAPLMLALIGVFFFKETLRGLQRAGLVLALAGFALFLKDQLRLGTWEEYRWSLLSIGVAAVTWALWATLSKVLIQRGERPQALNLFTYGLAGVLFLPFADVAPLARADFGDWCVLVFLGANTLLAYGALGEALRDAPANQVSMIITLNPLITLAVMAVLTSLEVAWIAREPIGALGYGGAALLVGGVLLVVRERPTPPPPSAAAPR